MLPGIEEAPAIEHAFAFLRSILKHWRGGNPTTWYYGRNFAMSFGTAVLTLTNLLTCHATASRTLDLLL